MGSRAMFAPIQAPSNLQLSVPEKGGPVLTLPVGV
jgi:hypothetical protein